MMTERNFRKALDDHITGVHDPNAPFNREDSPICEEYAVEDCKEPCEKLKKLIEENDAAHWKQEEKFYEDWKKENPNLKEE